jgi:hypothetical protein
MKRHMCVSIIASLVICIGLAACSDEPGEFTMHKAGEYKGTRDPLLAIGEHQELNKRFMQVQTDR